MKNVVRADEKDKQDKHQVPLHLGDILRSLSEPENVNVIGRRNRTGETDFR
jgi:hypothetical protein